MKLNKDTLLFLGIGALAGTVTGSVVTYFVVQKRYTRLMVELEDNIYESFEDFKKLYPKGEKYEAIKEIIATVIEQAVDVEEVDTELADDIEKPQKTRDYSSYHANKIEEEKAKMAELLKQERYIQEVAKGPADSEDEEEEEEVMLEDLPPIHLITADEFLDATDYFTSYDKISLTYYDGDGVLTDDREEPVNDINKIIGDDATSSFGLDPTEPDVVYVRNNRIKTDFEIVRVMDAYTEAVLGIELDEPVVKKAHTPTKKVGIHVDE